MDWNEDGLLDLITGEENGKVSYYKNIGTANNPALTFNSYLNVGGHNIDIGYYSNPWVDDWNEDGLKDLLVGGDQGTVNLFINEGTSAAPLFNSVQSILIDGGETLCAGDRSSPVVVDLDGDGLKDLLTGNGQGSLLYYHNNGTNSSPQLADSVALCMGDLEISSEGLTRIAPTDWDQDGDCDLIIGTFDSRLLRFMQTPATDPQAVVSVTLNSSGMIMPGGGTLEYLVEVANQTGSPVTFDVWTEVEIGDDSFYGPLLLRNGITMQPATTLSRNLSTNVPASAPGVGYYFYTYAGDFDQQQIYSLDFFNFFKMGDGENAGSAGEWTSDGWDLEKTEFSPATLPDRLSLTASPNPFNPLTTIYFNLPSPEQVRLNVYDHQGRLVESLVSGWRDAGAHEVTFDASGLASGIYLYRLHTGEIVKSGKVVLIK